MTPRSTFRLPAGTVDVHTHVIGPVDRFPFATERKYTPADAPKEALFARRDNLGVTRQVIVQATCHGTDHRALVNALHAAGDRARGVAQIDPDIGAAELAALHAAGVRGVRLVLAGWLGEERTDRHYREIASRIREFGWHLVLFLDPSDLDRRWELIAALATDLDVVIDHLGRADVAKPVNGAEFDRFRTFVREHPRTWVKVSGADRLSAAGPPYDDVQPFAAALVEEFPDRVLWGTDWPHPNLRGPEPNDADLVDLIPRIAPTPELQERLLVDNPMRLYWSPVR